MTFSNQHPTSASLMLTLQECHKSGKLISIQCEFEEQPVSLFNVPIVAIDMNAQKFQVKRPGDDIGKWFALKHIQSITLQSGERLVSPAGEAYWKEIQNRRLKREEWRKELVDVDHIPDLTKAPQELSALLLDGGTRILGPLGSNRDVELWNVRSRYSGTTTIWVKDAIAARRVCGLVGESYWMMAKAWLECEFVWPSWVQSNPDGASIPGETITSMFQWGATIPAELANLFMAKSWERHQIFKPKIDHLTLNDVWRLHKFGLAVPADRLPLDALFEHAMVRDLRSILKTRGIKFLGRDQGIAHLRAASLTDSDGVRSALSSAPGFVGKWCLIPPCDLTWSEWQAFRNWHCAMIFAFLDFF